jgi:hypothetical protein
MKYRISEKKRKSKLNSLSKSAPVLILCMLALGFLGKAAWNAYMEKRRSDEAVAATKAELSMLEEREAFILSELEKGETMEGIEHKLREKFGLGRQGEQVAIIVEAESENNTESGFNLLSKLKDFFSKLLEK